MTGRPGWGALVGALSAVAVGFWWSTGFLMTGAGSS